MGALLQFARQIDKILRFQRPSHPISSALLWRTLHSGNSAKLSPTDTLNIVTSVPLSLPAFQVWGANTGVGKTLVSSGLFKEATTTGKGFFLKPVQTGFPSDSDARLVAAVCASQETIGAHAAEIAGVKAEQPRFRGNTIHTEYAWEQPVSPHLAVQNEGRGVDDSEIREKVVQYLSAFATSEEEPGAQHLALVETAGGPGSPGPSGRLQCDLFRPLRLPAILVGDGKLGGISTTLAAYEMLSHRGYDVAAIALLEDAGDNAAALRHYQKQRLGNPPAVFTLPACQDPQQRSTGETGTVDDNLAAWLEKARPGLREVLEHLKSFHTLRVEALRRLAGDTLDVVWYPFTQHKNLKAQDITVIDARAGEELVVFQEAGDSHPPRTEAHFDACASWWTQGVNAELHPKLVSEVMKGVSRYGHVMHPNAAIEPTLHLAEILLNSVGKGWADRVFYSDDG